MLLLAPVLLGWVCLAGGQDAPGTTVTSPDSHRILDRGPAKLALVGHRPGVRVMRRRKQRRLDDSAVKLGTRKRVLGSRGERKWKRIRVRKKQRELKEKAKSSGGKRKATQQLNSVSGGRGREIGAGRTEKLIEAVIKTVTEDVTEAAIKEVKDVEDLDRKVDGAVSSEFMKNAPREDNSVLTELNRSSTEQKSDSSEHKNATISKSASIRSISESIQPNNETTVSASEMTPVLRVTTKPEAEKVKAVSVTFYPESETLETTQDTRIVTTGTIPQTTVATICSPVTMGDEGRPKSDAMEPVSKDEMALTSNTTEPTPIESTEFRSLEEYKIQNPIQSDVSKSNMATSTEHLKFISTSGESSRRSSSVYVDSSVIRDGVELRPAKYTAVRTAPSKTETEATTRSSSQTPASDTTQVTTVSVTTMPAASEPHTSTETPPSPELVSTTHTNSINKTEEHTTFPNEDMEVTIPMIPTTPAVTASSTTLASSQIRDDDYKLNQIKDLETSLNEIETRPKKSNKAKNASLGFAGDNYLALRQNHKARSTTSRTLSTQTTTTPVQTTTRRTSKPPRRKTTKSGVHPDLQRVNKLNNKIAMLKAELDLLLNFNENVLDFDSSIVSSAAKTKVEDFFLDLSNTIDDFMGPRKKAGSTSTKARISAAESVLTAGEDIATRLASTVELGSQVDISLANISMTVMKRRLEPRSVPSSSSWSSGLVEVELPDQVALAGKDNSISLSFSSFNNLGDLMTAESQVSSPVLSVSALGDPAGMEIRGGRRWTELESPIQFTARHGPVARHSAVSCVYWHFPSSSWATQGCTSRSFSPTATTCSCSHLTSFALLVLPPPPPPTWAPLTFYSGPPAVSRPTPTTEPVTEAWSEGWEEQLFYSAAPKYGERIRVTRRGREGKERAEEEEEEVEERGLVGVVWGGVILSVTVICTSVLLWDQRRRRRTGRTGSSSTSSTHTNNMSPKGLKLKDEEICCYDDTFLTCLEQDVIV